MLKSFSPSQMMNTSLIAGGFFVVLYVALYLTAPFSEAFNDLLINGMIVLAAAGAALLLTLVWRKFEADDAPRLVWAYFACGVWTWTLGEMIWMYYAYTRDVVPAISLADFFYTGAYCFFAAAFTRQYRLLFNTTFKKAAGWIAGISAAVILTSLLTGSLLFRAYPSLSTNWLETQLAVFYPFGDLVLAAAALYLAQLFGRGMWGRIWIGLLVLVVSDAIYAALFLTGMYSYSVENGNALSLFADTFYFSAYLLLLLTSLSQLLLLKYGPPASSQEQIEVHFEKAAL
jgi:hypothetical protein